MTDRWTDQSTPGAIKCAHCDHVYAPYDGDGLWFMSKDGSARVSYEAILLHCREKHPEFYRRKYAAEAAQQRCDPRFAPL